MTLVARRVQAIREQQGAEALDPAQPLADFRSTPAWVLLGEPGAGKSQALSSEASATDGQYLTVSELIASDPLPEEWRGRTLYIDALDEVRAAGSESPLARIRNQLRRLGSPPFRLACRAADWYGPSDRGQLEGQSPDGRLVALQLCPLSQDDVRQILHDNHGVDDPQAFIEQAERHGIGPLLENPQTLELLAKAIRDDDWPESRSEVYRLACERLAHEENREHRNLQKQHRRTASDQQRLQAAGQLFAVLLLSGTSGIASDPDAASAEFPTLEQLAPTEPQAAEQALHSKLFMPAPGHEERLIPSHRSIAEYLAAAWLAGELDNKRLPRQRLLNLLLGADGGVVSDLRGLYAWLTLHSIGARTRLIEADPLSVILYGDARPMSLADKRALLAALQEQARRFPGYRWQGMQSLHPFGALADEGLVEDFRKVLRAPERDIASQVHLDCVLDILKYGDASPSLSDALLEVIKDSSHRSEIRRGALQVWLKASCAEDALTLLDQISQGEIDDENDQMAGVLLRRLYPQHLAPMKLLRYLHSPKQTNFSGAYNLFWGYELYKIAPDDHLPILLDGLTKRHELFEPGRVGGWRIFLMANHLLARGLQVHGDILTDERLFAWLGVGADKYGYFSRDKEPLQQIRDWLSERPERYKAILKLCIVGNEQNHQYLYDDRLHGACTPCDLGLWHLEQASHCAEPIARIHLADAVGTLIRQQGTDGLSLETLEEWALLHPDKAEWLEKLLICPVIEQRLKYAAVRSTRDKEQIKKRRRRTEGIKPHLADIGSGQVRADILHQLACVWLDLFHDVSGQNIAERFSDYCDIGPELMAAAETGFKQCPLRGDLPTVEEIISLKLKKQHYLISHPCLLGMELLWQENPVKVQSLPADVMPRMVAFRLTDGAGEASEWFNWLVQMCPTIVAGVLVTYTSAALKAGESYVSGMHELEHDKNYREIAALATPELLRAFPLRAKKNQLNRLESLLKAAMRHAQQKLPALIDSKLALKSLDSGQRVYWLASALLLDPLRFEEEVWRYIGKSTQRANTLASFFSDSHDRLVQDYLLPPKTLGRLIELIAPHAELEQMRGEVTDAMRRGDWVRTMINRLAGMPTPEASRELDRLLGLDTLAKLKYSLESARHQQRTQQREANYRFQPVETVARILANREPANVADLAALTLDLLDEIAHEIRHGNDDGFASFWNINNRKPESQREENRCRDVLLTRLRSKLEALGISIAPEADHHNDKRADLCLDYRNRFSLPIEIKRDSNPELWTGLRKQLIGQYADAPKSDGNGIYLVLWFGGNGMPRTIDGGKKPTSAEELKARLEGQLNPEERQRIHVRVLDVSWPDL